LLLVPLFLFSLVLFIQFSLLVLFSAQLKYAANEPSGKSGNKPESGDKMEPLREENSGHEASQPSLT
jgi:hypothetical protein